MFYSECNRMSELEKETDRDSISSETIVSRLKPCLRSGYFLLWS